MKKELFGKLPSGEEIYLYTVSNDECSLSVMEYGASIVEFTHRETNIVGGFDSLNDYLSDNSNQGRTIGRVANRIKDGIFTIDGVEYSVTKNQYGNCLHGGNSFATKPWKLVEHTDSRITLSYVSKDGEEGFPSTVNTEVSFTLDGSAMIIEYKAIPDGKTPISLTNHTYFNIDGLGETVDNQVLTIYADRYNEIGERLLPTGKRIKVEDTPFDFRTPCVIGERLNEEFKNYDHNYFLCPEKYVEFRGNKLPLAAELSGKTRRMSVYTDQPCVQLYTGYPLGKGADFRGGIKQVRRGALCLETQIEPNSVNYGVGIYGKGEVYSHIAIYKVELL